MPQPRYNLAVSADRRKPVDPAGDGPPQLVRWEFAGLMVTYWCSSRCAFCYVYGGPEHDRMMTQAHALALWRGLDALAAEVGGPMRIHLAGGEAFRDWPYLASLVRAAHDAGHSPLEKVETNAFWAVTEAVARSRLELLNALGMERLVVSADEFHQEFVPFARVQNVVAAARQVLGTGRLIVRWWDFVQQPIAVPPDAAGRWAALKAAFERHTDRLTGRAAEQVAPLLPGQPADAFAEEHCRVALLESKHVHIDPYGNIFPGICAGIILGRAQTAADVNHVWHTLAATWATHPVIARLVAGGSYALYEEACKHGYQPLESGYASKCHLCAHVRRFLHETGVWPECIGPAECYGGRASDG